MESGTLQLGRGRVLPPGSIRKVTLTNLCWQCLNTLKDTGFSLAYATFCGDNWKLVQASVRKNSPRIVGDLIRVKIGTRWIIFSLSDSAMSRFAPRIIRSVALGAAVQILGAYESYVKAIGVLIREHLPDAWDKLGARMKKGRLTPRGLVKSEFGRGIDVFTEVFGTQPKPLYSHALEFYFQLRNVGIHNAGIADDALCSAAKSPFVKVTGRLSQGTVLSWTAGDVLGLEHLLTQMLPEMDPHVHKTLPVHVTQDWAFWAHPATTPARKADAAHPIQSA